MTSFSSSCPSCGESVTLPIGDGTLHIPTVGPTKCHYTCPECDEPVALTVSESLAENLVARGMPAERVEVAIPSQHRPGPVITWDDVIDFGRALEATDRVI